MDPKAYRLPTNVYPTRYDIEIDARLGREDFHGNVTIGLDVREETDTVELHARDLQLSEARLLFGGKSLEGEITLDADSEMASIRFPDPVWTGEATLHIAFKGEVSKGLEGLYTAKDGPEECLCTQCEETEARRIFPCFDEPTFKAGFAWKVTTAKEHTVLANGPLLEVEESADGDSRTWSFAPTKLMSSYLVALVIGDVASTEESAVGDTTLRIWALRGKEGMGEFAHNYTARLFPWYEEYFGAPYHYDKYDQAAVPGFAAGAMENSGLVLFRQNLLLMNPQTASWGQEKVIAHVVAHEMAHMWFGNLVTMAWWDDLWLNEAFAEWIAHKAVDTLDPDYGVWNDFQPAKSAAMSSDALASTHPIYSPVETPAQAAELFDIITYQKGCAVMRMLETFLGEEAFRAGLRTYMQEFGEKNAAGPDLWRHLAEASKQPVADIMSSWVGQGGYPVVSIGFNVQGSKFKEGGAAESSSESISLRVRQSRFYSDPNMAGTGDALWQAPLIIRYADGAGEHETRYLLKEREATIPLEVSGDLEWCYANAAEVGFYRQNPDEATLRGLLSNLDKLSPVEQMGLLGDQYALVRNGASRMTQFLDVLAALSGTENHNVLEEVVGRLHTVETLLEAAGDEEATEKYRSWVNTAFMAKLERAGFEPKDGEGQNEAQSRRHLIGAMTVLAHNEGIVAQATEWADRERADPASVDPNLAGAFVGAAAHFGDHARFDRYVETYKARREAGASPQETSRYLYSLYEFRQPETVARVFELMDDETLPQEAKGPFLRTMLATPHTQEAAWEYVKSHWEPLRNLGDLWTSNIVIASGQLPARLRDDMVAFYDANLGGVAEMSYARALETLDQLAEFKERTRDDLVGWFKGK